MSENESNLMGPSGEPESSAIVDCGQVSPLVSPAYLIDGLARIAAIEIKQLYRDGNPESGAIVTVIKGAIERTLEFTADDG